jgi:hypothetical protein
MEKERPKVREYNLFGQEIWVKDPLPTKEELAVQKELARQYRINHNLKRKETSDYQGGCLCTMRESCPNCNANHDEEQRSLYNSLKDRYGDW